MAADENGRDEDDEGQAHQHYEADSVEDSLLVLGADEFQDGIKERADLLLHVAHWVAGSLRLKAPRDTFGSCKELSGFTSGSGWCLQGQEITQVSSCTLGIFFLGAASTAKASAG